MNLSHISSLEGMSEKDICGILNLADQLKFEKENKIPHKLTEPAVVGTVGKLPALVDTAVQISAYELGALAARLPDNIDALVASKYAACIIAGFDSESEFSAFAEKSEVPVMAAYSGKETVIEALSEMMTVREQSGSLENKNGSISESEKLENILHVTKAVLAIALKNNLN